MARRRRERAILFPWERRRGLSALPWARTRPLVAGVVTVVVIAFFGARERDKTGTRATRATMMVVRQGIDEFRADHDSRCPDSFDKLRQGGYLRAEPVDAWGRPLTLMCPGRRDPESYDLFSYGASGDMRGLDRVE